MTTSLTITKTCDNCKHFHWTVGDLENPLYHEHYYCDAWRTFVPAFYITDETKLYDDIEKGLATCWLFDSSEGLGYFKNNFYKESE